MKRMGLLLAVAVMLLTGCSSLLQREYSVAEPHISKYWESEAADTLRAENYQDIVNDLLLLIGQHTEKATLRLYNYKDEVEVTDILERATIEIQQETPLGAYAVEYITSSCQAQRGYYEVTIQIGYRQTAQQIQAVVNATSPEAVYSLLESALDNGRTELAIRIGYWGEDGQGKVETAMAQLREERGLTETPMWWVNYYPASGPIEMVEFLLDPPEELIEFPAETGDAQEEPQEGLPISEPGAEDSEENPQENLPVSESGIDTEK